MQGCNFHLDQALLKHMKNVPGFFTKQDLQEMLYHLFGMAFLPTDEVSDAWNDYKHLLFATFPESEDFCEYEEEVHRSSAISLLQTQERR